MWVLYFILDRLQKWIRMSVFLLALERGRFCVRCTLSVENLPLWHLVGVHGRWDRLQREPCRDHSVRGRLVEEALDSSVITSLFVLISATSKTSANAVKKNERKARHGEAEKNTKRRELLLRTLRRISCSVHRVAHLDIFWTAIVVKGSFV